MFTEKLNIQDKYRDMFSSGEYIAITKNNQRINDNIPLNYHHFKRWMEDKSIDYITFLGKNYFDGVICKISYNELCFIEQSNKLHFKNEEAFEFNYIGGADF